MRFHPKLFIKLLITCVILFMIFIIKMKSKSSSRNLIWNAVNYKEIGKFKSIHNRLACRRDQMEIWPEAIKNIMSNENSKSLACNTSIDWVTIENGKIIFKNDLKIVNDIYCTASSLKRIDDFHYIFVDNVDKIINNSNVPSDFFELICVDKQDFKMVKYSNLHSAIKRKPISNSAKLKDSEEKKWNVLFFGFDSVSRLQWQRVLPKTHKFWTEILNATILDGYNIVGDGTPQAFLPILTGHNEIELPEARRGHKGAKEIDGHPWIWKDYKKEKYVTQYAEDQSDYGTFSYRMLGFKDQPTDYYMRPFQVESLNKVNEFCLGSRPVHTVMTNWVDEMWKVYNDTPKFSVSFHAVYSHDSTVQLKEADDSLLNWLKYLNDTNVFDDTFVFLMSDHGARYSTYRSHLQGKYEERNPYFSLRIPNKFHKIYPNVRDILRNNKNRLISPFDIHETFKDILNYDIQSFNNVEKRGLSILKEIPLERTCSHAFIEPHWCSCLSWRNLNITDNLAQLSTLAIVDKFNEQNNKLTSQCRELKLETILSASIFDHNDFVKKFKKSEDSDGRIPLFDDDTSGEDSIIQLKFITYPNSGHYEATIKHYFKNNENHFDINFNQISRINKYGLQPKCIAEKYPELRAFCFCKA